MTSPSPRAFVVGYPIAHSRSPMIHRHWLDRYGLPGSYERVAVPPDDFASFLRGFEAAGFAGGNVTIPHKEAAFRLVDRPSERARRLGAVNTVWREGVEIHGDNTDILGFAADLDAGLGAGWEDRCGTALVLGAGGAARAVVATLLDRGLEILVANRSLQKAEALRDLDPDRVGASPWESVPEALSTVGLLVNATSLGMSGQPPLAIDLAPLAADAAVYDLVYVPLETPLVAAARARGLVALDGLGMLLHQAAPGFRHWFGRLPEVTAELRALVAADIPPR